MKIDIMPMKTNNLNKMGFQTDCETSFINILDDTETPDKVVDEVLGLISSLLNNINTQSHIDINKNSYNLCDDKIDLTSENFTELKNKNLLNSFENNENILSVLEKSGSNDINKLYEVLEKTGTNDMSKLYEVLKKLGSNDMNNLYEVLEKIDTNDMDKLYEALEKSGSNDMNKLYEILEKLDINNKNKVYKVLENIDAESIEDIYFEKRYTHKLDILNSNDTVSQGKISAKDSLAINNVESLLHKDDEDFNKTISMEDNNFDVELDVLKSIASSNSNIGKESNIIEPKYVRGEFITRDINQVITYLNSNNLEELNLKMSPRDLGDINIKLIKSDKENRVIITLGKEDVFNLINKNLKELESLINTTIKEVSVSISCGNQSNFSDNLSQNFKGKNNPNNGNKKLNIEEDLDYENTKIDDNNINLLA